MATTPSQQDFLNTQDLTNASSVTGAQLNQILTTGLPFTDKGIIMWTTDASNGSPSVPDATTYTKWQTYIWGRIGNSAITPNIVTFYFWNPYQGSGALQRWVPLFSGSVGTGSITPSFLALPNSPAYGMIYRINAAGNAWEIVLNVLAKSANLATLGTAGQILQVNSGGSDVQWITNVLLKSANLGALGTAYQALIVNSAGTDVIWQTNVLLKSAALANFGTAGQSLIMNPGASDVQWVTNVLSKSAAMANLGTAGQLLNVNAGATDVQWITNVIAAATAFATLGTANQVPAVNSAGNGMVWVTPAFITRSIIGTTAGLGTLLTSSTVPGLVATFAHGLAAVPNLVRLVLSCTNNDAATGYDAGQIISQTLFSLGATGAVTAGSGVSYYADNTNVYLSTYGASSSQYFAYFVPITGAAFTKPTSANNFQFSIIAAL